MQPHAHWEPVLDAAPVTEQSSMKYLWKKVEENNPFIIFS